MNRNSFIKTFLGGALISKIDFSFGNSPLIAGEVFSLPKLPYTYDALEPNFDTLTMEIHHSRHHQAYVTNLNKAITDTPAEKLSLDVIIKNISKYPVAVRNNGGGHWNHSFFWNILTPTSQKPSEKILKLINRDFGSFEKFQTEFNTAATTRFGSGWAWVIVQNKKLKICSTANQDNPLMDIAEVKGKPILGIDVWEHAYYLKYQNKRADYIKAFWNLINWKEVESLI
jgi:Fe-Mn family superoxide dismutase